MGHTREQTTTTTEKLQLPQWCYQGLTRQVGVISEARGTPRLMGSVVLYSCCYVMFIDKHAMCLLALSNCCGINSKALWAVLLLENNQQCGVWSVPTPSLIKYY